MLIGFSGNGIWIQPQRHSISKASSVTFTNFLPHILLSSKYDAEEKNVYLAPWVKNMQGEAYCSSAVPDAGSWMTFLKAEEWHQTHSWHKPVQLYWFQRSYSIWHQLKIRSINFLLSLEHLPIALSWYIFIW